GRENWYIDGSVVANEPIRALLSDLPQRVNPQSTYVDVYSVSSLPLAAAERAERAASDATTATKLTEYAGLVEIARRALRLERFRDATLERRMTEIVTRSPPPGGAP